jgi:hypothetical protein
LQGVPDDGDAQFLVNNLDQSEDYLAPSCDLAEALLAIDLDTVNANFITFQLNELTQPVCRWLIAT